MENANERFLENHEFLQYLGITVEHQEPEVVHLSLPHRAAFTNPGSDVLQGGIVATLVDHAGGAAIRTTLEDPLETPHATTDLNVSYLRPATADLLAKASVVRAGHSMGVVTVEVVPDGQDEGDVIALGRVSLHLDRD